MLTPSNLKLAKLELSGLDEYLKKIQAAGNNVDEAVKKAVEASCYPVNSYIKDWAEEHKFTGETLKGVKTSEIKQDGNYIYAEVGIDTTDAPTAWHAVFVEYGTPTQSADPGIRNAFDKNKSLVKGIQKDVLAKAGVPVE
jgi:HK97 gp10 family phage protein